MSLICESAALIATQADRLGDLSDRLDDLVRQVGEQQRQQAEVRASYDRQFSDLRLIITNHGEEVKRKNGGQARTFAEVQAFLQGDDES